MRSILGAIVALVLVGCGPLGPTATNPPPAITPAPVASAPTAPVTDVPSPSPAADGRVEFFDHTDTTLADYSTLLKELAVVLEGSDDEAKIEALIGVQAFALTEQTWARAMTPDPCLTDAHGTYLRLFENVEKTFDSYSKYVVLGSVADREAALAGSALSSELIEDFIGAEAIARSYLDCKDG